jgi:hypothetical protein
MTDHNCRIKTIVLKPNIPSLPQVFRPRPGDYFKRTGMATWERTDLHTYVVSSR